jgi:diguanylate cyclase (GGDEF)-like protein
MTFASKILSGNVGLLKAKASKSAISGVLISCAALIAATMLSGYSFYGEISLKSFVHAQKNNPVLWFLDVMPFLFAVWGQYVSSIMAFEAGAMVLDQTEELRAKTVVLESKATHDATHDSLTGLPNRVLFRDRVEQALNAAGPPGLKLAVLLLGLDRFKEINNTLGHYNGDRILKQVATRLESLIMASETVARMGGDEFAILLPEVKGEQDIKSVVAKIQKAMTSPFVLEGLRLEVQVSIGAAMFPEHGTDGDTLMQRADVARYVAKDDRNGFKIYSQKLDKFTPQRLTLMGELRQGIDREEFFLFYQPKVSVVNGRINSGEALVRWQHHKHGIILPDDFIPLAERTGLIKDLSKYILKRVLEQIAEWLKNGLEISVSVNLSAQDLLDPDFPDVLAGLFALYDVPPSQLVLEITETTIISDPERALEIMFRLADMGVKMSIDDFGTGYSSLSRLKKMPVSEIKIDRSFVLDMMENSNDEVIVQATVGLAHNLGLKVVAEGVETHGAAERLKELGCDFLQGFLFSEAVSPAEFAELASKSGAII